MADDPASLLLFVWCGRPAPVLACAGQAFHLAVTLQKEPELFSLRSLGIGARIRRKEWFFTRKSYEHFFLEGFENIRRAS